MLHQFRDRLELTQLRRVNEHLLQPLLEGTGGFAKTVATNAYKNGSMYFTQGVHFDGLMRCS